MEETRNVWENEELLNIVTVGHVDHGKSTVIGRLLADAGALPKGKLESIRENCRRNSKPFEYAFLLDALHNEQDQGITIDTARCFFKSDKRRYIIIDAPGHIEFLKNMVTGASRAEAALMVIDAARGVEENTRRHGYFLSMLGIRQVAVLVNKMDLVGYSEEVYRSIVTEFTEFLAKINISPAAFIPVSGMEGDNIAIRSERTPWYFGPTVLEQMDAFVPVPSPENRPLRMPVQGVYKFTEGGDERRIVAGTLEAGSLRAGDKIVFYPSGKKTTVASLEVFSAPTPEKFIAGDAAGFTMTEQIFVRRGEIACLESEEAPFVGVRLRANVFWLGKEPLRPGKRYFFKCGTAKVEARLESILRVVDASELDSLERSEVQKNEVAEVILRLDRPTAFDTADSGCDGTRRFVIVDDYEIAGGGIVTEALLSEDYDKRNIRWSAHRAARARRMDDRAFRLRQNDDRAGGRAAALRKGRCRLHARRRQAAPRSLRRSRLLGRRPDRKHPPRRRGRGALPRRGARDALHVHLPVRRRARRGAPHRRRALSRSLGAGRSGDLQGARPEKALSESSRGKDPFVHGHRLSV